MVLVIILQKKETSPRIQEFDKTDDPKKASDSNGFFLCKIFFTLILSSFILLI